jgi:outer membrane protein assembly factor BamB
MRSLSLALLVSIGMVGCASNAGMSGISGIPPPSGLQGSRPSQRSSSTTVTISASGGSFALPQYGGFRGTVTYNANNAASGATLTLTNSGTNNLLGAPLPTTGTPVLYLEASIGAASRVAFESGSNAMSLKSEQFLNGGDFEIDAYEGSKEVASYAAGTPTNRTLTFQTPFSGLSIHSGHPLTVEVVLLGTDWASFGFDLQRTGYNPLESTVGVSNVGSLQKVWTFNVGDNMVHEPVYAYGVNVKGQPANVLYAGSAAGSTMYAINASTGAVVWQDPVASSNFHCVPSQAFKFAIGGVPAIDRGKDRLYFADGHNLVHAVHLGTGKEASGWPVRVADYAPDHNFMHGGLTYNPDNGLLYAETGATCDVSPWYGRIVAINTNEPSIVGTFFTMGGGRTQGASGGGIWGWGGGSIDQSTNHVFVATGNADTTKGAPQNTPYAEQVIELPAYLSSILAHNYPTNIPSIYGDDDFDFGATPLLFQPSGCPPLVAAINKSGVFELYDRGSISNGPIQYIYMSVPSDRGEFVGVPAFDPVTGYVYVGLPTTEGIYRPGLAAFSIRSNCTLNPTPVWSANFGPDGSASQTSRRSPISIANGVVYVSNYTGDTEYAFNAATGAQLWTVGLSGPGDVGTVIANGMVFVGSVNGAITAWTLPAEAKRLRQRVVKANHSMVPVYRSWPATLSAPWTP